MFHTCQCAAAFCPLLMQCLNLHKCLYLHGRYMHKLRCWLDHTTRCAWPCSCCANQLQQLYNLCHSVHSIVDCSAACNADDERIIVGHFSDLVSMTCQLLASKHVLGSPQTVNALLVLMTALADARFHAANAKT